MIRHNIKSFIFLIVFICPIPVWADFNYDLDEDCDVDGLDLSILISDYSADLEEILSVFSSEFGGIGSCCEPVEIGDPINGYPNWHERVMLVFTNMVRMAPQEYRDEYMTSFTFPNGGILNSYPPVPPLHWNYGLNQASRHHASDMAYNCGRLQHDSCDGTPWHERILSFYPHYYSLGENIAWGFPTPWSVINGFLCDQQGSSCAPDKSDLDGHRANIMKAFFKEIGTGYVHKLPSINEIYWVQDFGGRSFGQQPPVIAASHAFPHESVTSFFLNYYDQSGNAPQEIQLILDGSKYQLYLDMGTATAGTYRADFARASDCRSYYFLVTDGNGICYRYPGHSQFWTYGEGECLMDYDD